MRGGSGTPEGVGSAAQGHALGSPSGHFSRTYFRCLFESMLMRSWLDFPSQLASPNPIKFIKNRCQEALLLGLQIVIDFSSILAPKLHPPSPRKAPTAGRARFLKNRLSKLASIFVRC